MTQLVFQTTELESKLQRLLQAAPPHERWIAPVRAPVMLYGAGALGLLGLQLLRGIGIEPIGFVDRGASPEGGVLQGLPVRRPEALSEADKQNCVFLISIVTCPVEPIVATLRALGCRDVRPLYDAVEALRDRMRMTNGWIHSELDAEDRQGIRQVFDRLANDESRAAYIQMLYWRIRHEEVIFQDLAITMADKWFPERIAPAPKKDESMVDGGAHVGTIIRKFVDWTGGAYAKVLAFEPDPGSFAALKVWTATLPAADQCKIALHQVALGDHDGQSPFISGRDVASRVADDGREQVTIRRLDSVIQEPVSFVKLHIEGAELPTILGGKEVFRRYRPWIAVTSYHTNDALWRIPFTLSSVLEDYQLYMRLHAYCGISCICYAVPIERVRMQGGACA